MIRMIANIGRAMLGLGAVALIMGGAAGGLFFDRVDPIGMAAGGFLGLLAAGLILGPMATLYDIADSLRSLVRAQKAAHP